MSHLNRILRKQRRIINRLKNVPIISLRGFGLSDILVFQIYSWKYSEISQESLRLQAEINEGKYKDIKDFDAYHTSDIEFSILYNGKYERAYQHETKRQLISLGRVWRERVKKEFPNSDIKIVVYFDHQNGAWFLDTYNWNIITDWKVNPNMTVWL